ncbi:MAG: hypothetical protein HY290_14450 [Planctomycetia bacterium]|nr:hypothetical protein [Planctomycetia bacterium]
MYYCRRTIAYLWVAPVTMGALLLVVAGVVTGGRPGVIRGVVEVHGGLVTWLLRRGSPWMGPIAAMTLGHVIIGRDQECLDHSRYHEHVHVRQYERWGPLFIPMYLGASVWCWFKGYDPYLDNPFELEAYAADQARRAL